MEIRIIDFEILTRHYTKYQNGLNEINHLKKSFRDKIEPFRKEMQNLMLAAQTDGEVIKERMERFEELKQEAIDIDQDYKIQVGQMQDKLTKSTYADLEKIISEWRELNSIDLVIGKIEVVCLSPKYESTDEILEILKSKNLFSEYKEEEPIKKEKFTIIQEES
jgi:Skp family chaperone for outer membrane proteins